MNQTYGTVSAPPLLPPGYRATAYWWACHRGLPVQLGYLQELGLRAARLAWQHGIPAARVPEGPFWCHTWPAGIWAGAEAQLAADFARFQAEYRSCPEPRGEAARDAVYGNGRAYGWGDYTETRQDERDAGWGPGAVPWDGDDIRTGLYG